MKQKAPAQTSMMRIAIAGGGGFAYILAQQITQTAHAVLLISQHAHTEFEHDFPDCQTTQVNFFNMEELSYVLQGVDVLISTISGSEQINLIDAALRARVRRFVPSEFEGALAHRPAANDDPFDRGSHTALDYLDRRTQLGSRNMGYTVFSCGIFMERFGPGGLLALNMGASCGVQSPGDYMVDIAATTAEIVETNAQGVPARVVLTSAYDVARFVAAALELGIANWPREFTMRGDSMAVRDVINTCSSVRGVRFHLISHTYQEAQQELQICEQTQQWQRYNYLQRLIQTANGRYYFRHPDLNGILSQHEGLEVRPMRFREWLQQFWGPSM